MEKIKKETETILSLLKKMPLTLLHLMKSIGWNKNINTIKFINSIQDDKKKGSENEKLT